MFFFEVASTVHTIIVPCVAVLGQEGESTWCYALSLAVKGVFGR